MIDITANQWRDAAEFEFVRTARELLGIERESDFRVTTKPKAGTPAITWDLIRDNDGTVIGADVTLFLPVMKSGAKLTRRDAVALAGYWIHELMHVLCTDKDAWLDACQRGSMFSQLVNGLEDPRGEAELIQSSKVPDTARCLFEIRERSVWTAPVTPQTVNDPKSLPALLAYLGRHEMLDFDLSRVSEIWAALTAENAAVVRPLLDGLKACQSTRDVVELVQDFFDQNAATADLGDGVQRNAKIGAPAKEVGLCSYSTLTNPYHRGQAS